MCDPLTLSAATAVIKIGQSAMQYIGQRQQAQVAQTSANLNFANRFNVTEAQRQQLDAEHSERGLDSAITAVKAGGEISASAADLGYSSGSLVEALNAEMFGIGRQDAVAAVNDRNARNQLANERTGAEIERRTTIAKNPKPSPLNLALSVGQTLAETASSYKQMGGR